VKAIALRLLVGPIMTAFWRSSNSIGSSSLTWVTTTRAGLANRRSRSRSIPLPPPTTGDQVPACPALGAIVQPPLSHDSGYLEHFFATTGDLYTTSPPAATGDRTNRGFLLLWVFDEMRRVRKIARKLVQMPRNDPVVPERAGPPFELPYSLRLPEPAADRWRMHRGVLEAAVQLVSRQLQPA
jgi:hypothetical protein